jgi:hypothetical protein
VLAQRVKVERRLRDHREEARWQLARAGRLIEQVRAEGGVGGGGWTSRCWRPALCDCVSHACHHTPQ